MFNEYLHRVVDGRDLSASDAEEAMTIIMTGGATDAQIGSYLTALRIKGVSADEISGSATAMRSVVEPIRLGDADGPLLDTCGTGGDGSHSFNISTAAAFVIAGAGRKVAKHGNRAASSKCGSADVLAELGLNLDLTPDQVSVCIEEVGICFLFAPKFHPAMRHAIGPRRELGFRTVFNILGPLTNPAKPSHQLIGVYDPSLTSVLAEALNSMGLDAALVVHGEGGLDELTTSGINQVSRLQNGNLTSFELDPASLRLNPSRNRDLAGGLPAENAQRMRCLLANEDDSTLKDVVILNAAAGLALTQNNLELGIEEARESLESGRALAKLDGLIQLSQRLQPAVTNLQT